MLSHKFCGSRFFSFRFAFSCAMFTILRSGTQLINSTTLVFTTLLPCPQQNRKVHKCMSDVNVSMQFRHLTEYNFLSLTRATLCCRPLKNTHRDFVTHIFIAKSSYNILMSSHTSKAQNIAIQPHHELQIPH